MLRRSAPRNDSPFKQPAPFAPAASVFDKGQRADGGTVHAAQGQREKAGGNPLVRHLVQIGEVLKQNNIILQQQVVDRLAQEPCLIEVQTIAAL